MKITRENREQGNVIIQLLIEPSDYEKNVADKLREYRQKASLPGFRPGKVPASLIQKRYAKPLLAEEVNELLTHNLTRYLEEEKLSILGDPLPAHDKQKPIDWEKDSQFEFFFEVAVAPAIHVDLAKTGSFRYLKIKVDDRMIDENIDSLCLRYGTNEETDAVGEKSTVRGDFVELDENGSEKEGGIVRKSVAIAVDLMRDETVRQEIAGKKAGDSLVFDPVKAYENRHEVGHMLDISHEEAERLNSFFRFTITSVLDFRKAEPGPELYEKVFPGDAEVTGEAAFREKMAAEIAASLVHSSEQQFHRDVRETLVASLPFELPEPFLKRWLKEVNQDKNDEEIERDFPSFLADLRWQLIKNSLIRDHAIGVTEEEITGFARHIALSQFRQYGFMDLPEEQLAGYVKKILEKEEDRERIVRQLFEGKVIGLVKEKGIVAEQEVTAGEFRSLAGIQGHDSEEE